jgi:hypothetical protein
MVKSRLTEVYGFSRSPFELGRYDTHRAGREVEWRRLQELIGLARGSRSPVIGVLLGTYGSGKSFLLWQLAGHYAYWRKTRVLASRPIRLLDPEQRRDFLRSLVIRLFRHGLDVETDLPSLVTLALKSPGDTPGAVSRFLPLLLALGSDQSAVVARRVLLGGRALRKEAEAAGFPEATQIRTNDDAVEC